jgi:hypothetical protein
MRSLITRTLTMECIISMHIIKARIRTESREKISRRRPLRTMK